MKKRKKPVKNRYLKKSQNTKVRQVFMDIDYIDQLNEKEQAWLNKFLKEELNASLSKRDKRRRDFNKTIKDRKRVFNNNNARNRCIYNIHESNLLLKYTGENDVPDHSQLTKEDVEDAVVDLIYRKERKKKTT